MQADVEALVELGVPASVIESPISELKLRALGLSRETMLERIRSAVSYAVESGIHVAYFGVDSTRAEPDFYDAAYAAAVEAGAAEVVVVDTIGVAGPEGVAELVGRTRELPRPGRSRSTSTATTTSAWRPPTPSRRSRRVPGGSTAPSTGWENAPGTPTSARSRCAARRLRRRDGPRPDEGPHPRRSRTHLSGYELEPWKPLIGENLFRRESGAVASQFHDPESIEPYSSELVSAERGIVLGKKSGLDSIRIKAEELGLDVPEERRAALLAAVKQLGTESAGSSPTRSSVSWSRKDQHRDSPP